MSDEEVKYQNHTSSSARRAYMKLYAQTKDRKLVVEDEIKKGEEEYEKQLEKDRKEYEESYEKATGLPFPDDYWWYGGGSQDYTSAGPWFGEVGRMVFGRFQSAPREFMWTPDITKEPSQMDPETKKTNARKASHQAPNLEQCADNQCYVNVNYDPHVSVAYVMLDKADPEVKLDYTNPAENGWNKQGDPKAITVTCDEVLADKGPEPDVAATRITTAATLSVETDEAKSTGDVKEGESDAAPKDPEPTPVAAA
jgi:hypothetical protein